LIALGVPIPNGVIARLDRMGAKIVEASLPFVDVFFVEVGRAGR
jgi:hypothetical protein